ncbi:hypothetical protein RchiOBHm_Chr2g0129291 [Rosa chinensis]|uniref:DUF7787 domain-containing protein n=1 Tax=Rosa chinensis TaxID=74649 RepID=A0A2P6RUJ2_ROSCH|nr:uncharacterized protein LOC112190180 [Rosa chinensis]XP_024185373.1 uncharacterized protein LOC112190180 [Rosa chinensis]PRQ50094.1 hypothetical protein RchiOBHm_Chr2g0129291 [Rosa chinensis]
MMDMVNVSQRKTKRQSEKMSLEDYLLLIQSRSNLHLTVTHLNQIISMHGFKKLHRLHKKVLSDAVSTLDLVEPSRSTLRDYISPPVNTFLNDVVADMNDLSWQECCVTAIKTLSSCQLNDAVECSKSHQSPPTALDSHGGGVSGTTFQGRAEPLRKLVQWKKRRAQESADPVVKRQRMRSESDGGGGAAALACDCVSLDSC